MRSDLGAHVFAVAEDVYGGKHVVHMNDLNADSTLKYAGTSLNDGLQGRTYVVGSEPKGKDQYKIVELIVLYDTYYGNYSDTGVKAAEKGSRGSSAQGGGADGGAGTQQEAPAANAQGRPACPYPNIDEGY